MYKVIVANIIFTYIYVRRQKLFIAVLIVICVYCVLELYSTPKSFLRLLILISFRHLRLDSGDFTKLNSNTSHTVANIYSKCSNIPVLH